MSYSGTNSLKGITNKFKGISWEEKYGKEKSELLKQNLSKITSQKFKGVSKTEEHRQKISEFHKRTYEEKYGIERAKELKIKVTKGLKESNNNRKGKTMEEIFGIERAIQIKESQKSKLKGKTYEEKYGSEIAKIRKEKISKAGKTWTKEKLASAYIEIVNKNGPILRSEIVKFAKKGEICYEQAIVTELGSLDELVKITGINFKQRKFYGGKGKNEQFILDNIEQQIGHKILRNYHIAGKCVDGFIPQLNIVYEVDEKFHQYKQVQDKIREEHIKNHINCSIIRIDEQKFLSNLNNTTIDNFENR